jgi:hypothetical protein
MMKTWNPAEIMERLAILEGIVKGIPTPVNVVANPEGEATADLEKLTVGDTTYEIPEGTVVEANPEGEASADLTKLTVGDTTYAIPVGGVTYSTTEQKIGKWVDGSDLYMRSFVNNAWSGTDWNFINDATLEIRGFVSDASYFDGTSSAGYHRFYLNTSYSGTTVTFIVNDTVYNSNTTHGNAHLLVTGSNMSYRAVVTIVYTKA